MVSNVCLPILSVLVLTCYVMPQDQQIENDVFDAGEVGACMVPQTLYCSEIRHQVPASIARLAQIIEIEIRSAVEPDGGDISTGCKEIIKETLCKQRFPICSPVLSTVTFTSSDNCEERLRDSCSGSVFNQLIGKGFCNYSQSSFQAGSCSRNFSDQLQHCNMLIHEGIQVTDWMHQYIRHLDMSLQDESYNTLRYNSVCWHKYTSYFCNFNGKCTGNRIHLINTYEICESLHDCYPDHLAEVITDSVPCHLWPSIRDSPINSPSNSPSQTGNPTTRTINQWPEPNQRAFIFNSSPVMLSSHTFILVALIVSLL